MSNSVGPQRSALSERRHTNRGPIQIPARLTVVDGPLQGKVFDILTRDQSLSGISFLLRESLSVGQQCQIDIEKRKHTAEIVRSRAISNGRFEMSAQFRKSI